MKLKLPWVIVGALSVILFNVLVFGNPLNSEDYTCIPRTQFAPTSDP